ncbi:hypothetical protein ABPH35_04030 [Streptococcus sp. ZJ93]|uniref:hypothetical protein n=1 Tax=Streptococcus handemini TaxID=3161188 RepID=UPI0032ED5836
MSTSDCTTKRSYKNLTAGQRGKKQGASKSEIARKLGVHCLILNHNSGNRLCSWPETGWGAIYFNSRQTRYAITVDLAEKKAHYVNEATSAINQRPRRLLEYQSAEKLFGLAQIA